MPISTDETAAATPATAGPPAPTPALLRLRGHLAIGARSLSLGGHDDFNQGQVSARLPGGGSFQIKGALTGFDECRPEDIVPAEVDPDAPPHRLAPPELPLHQAVYAARPDINAIVHSHAPYTLVFGATDLALRPVSHDGACFEDRLSRFTVTSNTILSIATGRAVAAALGPDPALLLRNHGGLVVGKSLKHAIVLAHLLERACRLQLLAESAPGGYHSSSATDVEAKREFIYGDLAVRSYWEHSVRAVVRAWPEAAGW
ncbi:MULTISPECIES: class II aldolase/adducin family protein [unclassified Kitasatospora]|uniref:class II aldolase/adducin family protein n=1 Tax=unclassified Kitasatospora TaxID=2633591 RepID=UPI0038116493